MLSKDVLTYLDIKAKIEHNVVSQLLKFEPHWKQEEIIDTYFEGKFSIMIITAGRRGGKTVVIGHISTSELLIPNASVLLFTPSFATAQTMFEQIERNILTLGIKITSKNSKALTFTLENRATIFVVTAKSYTNALGRRFSLVVFDESQDIQDLIDIYENYIQPAQADFGVTEDGYSNSKTVLIGTARDETNDMYLLKKRAHNPKYFGYLDITFPTTDNPYISREYLAQKKKELDPITYSREYEGKWSKGSGERVYYTFDKDKHTITAEERTKYMPTRGGTFLVAIDVGFTDNTGYLLAYKQPQSGRIVIFAEYRASELPMSHHVKEFKAIESFHLEGGTYVSRYIDPSAIQASNDMAVDAQYYTFPAYNKIDEGVKIVNSAFFKGDLVISEECPELIDEIENLIWQNAATKTVRKTKTHKHFDLSLSTMRYLVATHKLQSEMSIVAI